MGRSARLVSSAIVASCAAVIFCCTIWLVFALGPAIETKLAPAVSKLRILDLHDNADGLAEISAEFTKLRDCEYIGIAWYRGSPSGGFERVPVILLRREGDTSSPNRPVGTQRAGPWIIGMPAADITGNSFAQLTHRCHPFWVTTTEFYP